VLFLLCLLLLATLFLCLYAGLTYSIVSTIVHFDGTPSYPFIVYATKTPKLLVKVNKLFIQVILNTRAKVNVITKAITNKLRLLVCTNLFLALKAVSKDTKVFDKACKDIKINIRDVVNY